MSVMFRIADAFRGALIPFLIGAALVWTALILLLVVQRGITTLVERRRLPAWTQQSCWLDAANRPVDGK